MTSFTGDGTFDRDDVYAAVAARHPEAAIIRAATLERGAEAQPHGLAEASGYNWHALAEPDIARWKPVVGDGIRSQTGGRQATEVVIAAGVLNRMLELGRPAYVRIA